MPNNINSEASQRLEQKRLELVQAMASVIGPLDSLLRQHDENQKLLTTVSLRLRTSNAIVFGLCVLNLLLIVVLVWLGWIATHPG